MAWSTPLTAVSNSALTAAQWNASVRDNLLQTAPALAASAGQLFVATGANAIAARTPKQASIATLETSASTTYVALATPGPVVTVTTGTQAIVGLYANISSTTGVGWMSYAVSGATTVAASDTFALQQGNGPGRASAVLLAAGLTPGSNTFTAQYRITGSGTGTWSDRTLWVIPL